MHEPGALTAIAASYSARASSAKRLTPVTLRFFGIVVKCCMQRFLVSHRSRMTQIFGVISPLEDVKLNLKIVRVKAVEMPETLKEFSAYPVRLHLN